MNYTIDNRFWLKTDKGTVMGEGRARLIELIAEHGSISTAAKTMGMSYRKALKLIDIMNESAPEPMVTTTTGGKDGGGAVTTEYGRKMAEAYRNIQSNTNDFLKTQMDLLP